MSLSDWCVIGRENNIVVVDFRRKPDPPAPRFPGGNALRVGSADGNEAPSLSLSTARSR